MMDEGDATPVENAKRKAAANAFINLSKKSCSNMKRVTWLLRKRQEDKRLTEDEQLFLANNPKLVDQFNKRREKRAEYQLRHIEKEDSPEMLQEKCTHLAQAIHDAEFLVAYTGAGISTAANIPDYRGPNGIWTRLQKGEDIGSHDLTEAEPTLTHMALSALQRCGGLQHIVSQNCDGLHLRSGLPKTVLSEVHGNMYIEVCRKCVPAREYVRTFDVTERTSTYKHSTGRRCYRCGEPLVDSIVHFGERGRLRWPLNWQGACQAANGADTILCLGSSLKVLKKYPWLWQMDRPARRRPRLYIINLQWTPKDKEATVKINGKCDKVMQIVMDILGMEIPPYNRADDLIFDMATPLHPDELSSTTRPNLMPPCGLLLLPNASDLQKEEAKKNCILKEDRKDEIREEEASCRQDCDEQVNGKSFLSPDHSGVEREAHNVCVTSEEYDENPAHEGTFKLSSAVRDRGKLSSDHIYPAEMKCLSLKQSGSKVGTISHEEEKVESCVAALSDDVLSDSVIPYKCLTDGDLKKSVKTSDVRGTECCADRCCGAAMPFSDSSVEMSCEKHSCITSFKDIELIPLPLNCQCVPTVVGSCLCHTSKACSSHQRSSNTGLCDISKTLKYSTDTLGSYSHVDGPCEPTLLDIHNEFSGVASRGDEPPHALPSNSPRTSIGSVDSCHSATSHSLARKSKFCSTSSALPCGNSSQQQNVTPSCSEMKSCNHNVCTVSGEPSILLRSNSSPSQTVGNNQHELSCSYSDCDIHGVINCKKQRTTSYECKCELLLRRLACSDACRQLLRCSACEKLLRFLASGSCLNTESERKDDANISGDRLGSPGVADGGTDGTSGSVSIRANVAVCSVSYIFCKCLDEGKLWLDVKSVQQKVVAAQLDGVAGAIVKDLDVGIKNNFLKMTVHDERRKENIRLQHDKIETLLALNDVKNEDNKEPIKTESIKSEANIYDCKIPKPEPLGIKKEEIKDEDCCSVTDDELPDISIFTGSRSEPQDFTPSSSQPRSSVSAACTALQKHKGLLSVSAAAVSQTPVHSSLVRSTPNNIIEITLEDDDFDDDATCTALQAPAASTLSSTYYGTGLCIRSTFDSCNDSTSQDDCDDDEEEDTSELESLGGDRARMEAGRDSEESEASSQCPVPENAGTEVRSTSNSLDVSGGKATEWEELTDDVSPDLTYNSVRNGLDESSRRARLRRSIGEGEDEAEIVSGDSRDCVAEDSGKHGRKNFFDEKETDVRWKMNGSIIQHGNTEIIGKSMSCAGGLTNVANNNHFVNDRNLSETFLANSVHAPGSVDFDKMETLDKYATSYLKNNLNGMNHKLNNSVLNETASNELKSIWFKSFCEPRRSESADGPTPLGIVSNSKAHLASIVNDLVERKHLSSGNKPRDDNVKKLWFWGFDDNMISKEQSDDTSDGTDTATEAAERAATAVVLHNSRVSEKIDVCASNAKENQVEADSDSSATSSSNRSPPRRVTRSSTRTSQDGREGFTGSRRTAGLRQRDDDGGKGTESFSDDEEDKSECPYCDGEMNPALCARSRETVHDRLYPDEVMLRARAVVARRRNINYKRYEPVFAVKLKTRTVTAEKDKRKSRGKGGLCLGREIKLRKIDWEVDEEDMEVEEKNKEGEREGSEEDVEKAFKKVTPGWYGKGYRKLIKKRVPKSYHLK